MRLTVKLDDDVATLLKHVAALRKVSLKAVVNEALRSGLRRMTAPTQATVVYRTPSVDTGRCLVADVDCIASALDMLEAEKRKTSWPTSRG